jgi:hypothetical protein
MKVTLKNGDVYESVEAKISQVMPFINLMANDTQKFQVELAKVSIIAADGQPIGERLMDVGIKDFMTLATAAMHANGFGESEGND